MMWRTETMSCAARIRKAVGDADKAAADAVIARENERNAELRAKADADAQAAQADLNKRQAYIEQQVAFQSARRTTAETCQARIKVSGSRTCRSGMAARNKPNAAPNSTRTVNNSAS